MQIIFKNKLFTFQTKNFPIPEIICVIVCFGFFSLLIMKPVKYKQRNEYMKKNDHVSKIRIEIKCIKSGV